MRVLYNCLSSTCRNGDPKRIFEEIYVFGGGNMDQNFLQSIISGKLNPHGEAAFRSIGEKIREELRMPGGKVRSVS